MHPDSTSDPPPASSWWLPAVLLVGLAIYAGTVYWAKSNRANALLGSKHLGVGQSLTEFQLSPLLNTEADVKLAEVRGQVVLLNYWGPWCGPCLAEFPELAELEKQYRSNEKVRFLLVSSDGGAGQSKAELARDTQAVLDHQRVNPPIYHDPQRQTLSAIMVSARLTEFGYPTTILVDRTGVIQGVWQGYDPTTVHEMRILLERLTRD